MKSFLTFLTIFLVFFIISCDSTDSRFVIVNKTNRPLFYTTSAYDTIEGRSPFQKFIEISNNDTIWIESDYFIKPFGEKKKMVMSDWEETIRNNFGGHIRVFIFDADTVQKYNWEDIKVNNKYFKKYEYTVDELNKINWKTEVKN